MVADIGKQVTCRQVNATTTSGVIPIFLGGVKKVIIQNATNDVYLDIDQPVAPTTAFRLFAANTAPTIIELEMGLMTNLYIQAVTGTAVVYIISIVG
jgi:hypothetical protein